MTISSVKTGDDGYDVNVTNTAWSTNVSSGRAVFGGGEGYSNVIDYVNILSTGNATDFGDLTIGKYGAAGAASSTRGLFIAGVNSSPAFTNVIEYITIASTGNAIDFGDTTSSGARGGAVSSQTRAVYSVFEKAPGNQVTDIDYITIATTGNATDFGDLSFARKFGAGGIASTTRGIFSGGNINDSTNQNVIDYITIATLGNATDFGDLTLARAFPAGASNSTRGLIGGGSSVTNVIDYVTIASTGNATDFGDLTVARYGPAGAANSTRALFGGGNTGSADSNVIDYVTIASTGNATDFGDLTVARVSYNGGLSNAHGGIAVEALQFTETTNPITESSQGIGAFFTSGDSTTNHIDYVDISSGGNSTDAGDLTVSRGNGAAVGSTTRAIHAGGEDASGAGTRYNVIDYAVFSSTGNAVDFGDLQSARRAFGSASDSTRGIFYGGSLAGTSPTNTNQIDYITMATAGNATDFGDAATAAYYSNGGASNGTRACFSGGYDDTPSGTNLGKIQYITIQTLGNGTNFGDQSQTRRGCGGASSNVRGVWFGGYTTTTVNTIDYITIATTGNATDFGDLTVSSQTGALSSKIKAIMSTSSSSTMNVVTIATTGNATTFGTRTGSRSYGPGASNSHGGL